jgi:hypothetical protein
MGSPTGHARSTRLIRVEVARIREGDVRLAITAPDGVWARSRKSLTRTRGEPQDLPVS